MLCQACGKVPAVCKCVQRNPFRTSFKNVSRTAAVIRQNQIIEEAERRRQQRKLRGDLT